MTGEEMRACRKRLGLTQAGMADAIGITATYIGLMERGKRPVEKRTDMAIRYLCIYQSTRATRCSKEKVK